MVEGATEEGEGRWLGLFSSDCLRRSLCNVRVVKFGSGSELPPPALTAFPAILLKRRKKRSGQKDSRGHSIAFRANFQCISFVYNYIFSAIWIAEGTFATKHKSSTSLITISLAEIRFGGLLLCSASLNSHTTQSHQKKKNDNTTQSLKYGLLLEFE